jgi:peptidoglycan-associated lipoprotein
MRRNYGVLLAIACAPLLTATAALAQPASGAQQPPPATVSSPSAGASQSSDETRRATTTYQGDTGLWYVPTGEILADKKWSVSFYRTNQDREAGFSDISHFIGTFGVGIKDRVEVFGSVRFITRIDRDIRPLYVPGNAAGGPTNDFPFVHDGWTGDAKFGDTLVGAKFNILTESRQAPVAFGLRGIVKLPTGDKDAGVSTGKADVAFDAIISKELNKAVELSGYAGYVVRGKPSEFDISNSFRWGFGAGFPTRSPLKVTAELIGEVYNNSTISGTPCPADANCVVGFNTWPNRNPVDGIIGITYQTEKGLFFGVGGSWVFTEKARSTFGAPYGDVTGDNFGWQARIGYHPGVKIYAPPMAPIPQPVIPPANHPPTVKARCEPCIVEVGKSSTITADGQDPDGDTLIYKWTTPSGQVQNPSDRQTLWTAPMQEGTVPVTVTVDDGKGGTASDTVQIQVVKPTPKLYTFEDVHFDFDRYTLRPEAARILDEAIKALQDNPSLRIEVEGHTCNIGTAEYNLALGERRATAVRDYLVSRGVTQDRLRTVSYGEERPKFDNSREETRRLNRRAALVVRVTQ